MERNINSLITYKMKATDGEIGDVKEFYFDDDTWDIYHLIVKTGSWLFGREVLIPPVALINQKWQNGLFPVNLAKSK